MLKAPSIATIATPSIVPSVGQAPLHLAQAPVVADAEAAEEVTAELGQLLGRWNHRKTMGKPWENGGFMGFNDGLIVI